MRTYVRLGFLAGACLGSVACGNSGAAQDDRVDSRATSQTEPIALCDGSDGLRFVATSEGGNAEDVPRVAREVGWRFLVIDGNCQYWVMERPDAELRTGTLNASDAESFSLELGLGSWPEQGQVQGCPDATVTRARFGDQVSAWSCGETTTVTEPYYAWFDTLYESGTAVDGPVRFSLSETDTSGWVTGGTVDIALPWTLSLDPAAVTVARTEEGTAEPLVATDSEAAALRTLRRQNSSQTAPLAPWLRIPIRDDRSGVPQYFNLAMRDVVPFETDGQLSLETN